MLKPIESYARKVNLSPKLYPQGEDHYIYYDINDFLIDLLGEHWQDTGVEDGVYWLPLEAATLHTDLAPVREVLESIQDFFNKHEKVWFATPYETSTIILMSVEPEPIVTYGNPSSLVEGEFNYGAASIITCHKPGKIIVLAQND